MLRNSTTPTRRAWIAALALPVLAVPATAGDTVIPLTPDTDTFTPSPLPRVVFDFEDKSDLGAFPFDFRLAGTAEIGVPPDASLVYDGQQGLVIHGGGKGRVHFNVPIESLDFRWREPVGDVKSTVTGFDPFGDIVYRADCAPLSWSQVYYSDPARPIAMLEFHMQSKTAYTVVDHMGLVHREAGHSFCAGDGFVSACPCGNESASGAFRGCENSAGTGARMYATGTPYVERRDLEMYVDGLPAGRPVMLFEGEATDTIIPFRDGLLCVASVTRRLDVAIADAAGAARLGAAIFDGRAVPAAGTTRDYQCWYRDPQISPCGSGSNFSQAQRVDWR